MFRAFARAARLRYRATRDRQSSATSAFCNVRSFEVVAAYPFRVTRDESVAIVIDIEGYEVVFER